MRYLSTRGGIKPISFSQSALMGLADDGGLIVPELVPNCRDRLHEFAKLNYVQLAEQIFSYFIDPEDIPVDVVKNLLLQSYQYPQVFDTPEVTPLIRLNERFYIQELFHGPTLAFKDLALQFIGHLFSYLLKRNNQELNILTATSGDTGSAAIYGVRGKERMNIFVIHPYQRISPLQALQMTSVLDPNVYNLAIQGTFDDGQRIIKEIFQDLKFKAQYHLGAVNSINWSRILAQIVYYFYAVLQVWKNTGYQAVQVCVPTGNFGNIFAGYLAWKMGAPIAKLILATNQNDILTRYFQTGEYAVGSVHTTYSPSMDIQVASNFERYLYYYFQEDTKRVQKSMLEFAKTGRIHVNENRTDGIIEAGSCNNEETIKTIREVWENFQMVIDPHTAVGYYVAVRLADPRYPCICLATAHPAKFPEAISLAIHQPISHPRLEVLKNAPTRFHVLPAEVQVVKQFIQDHLRETNPSFYR